MRPKVSVVMAVYNGEGFLRQAVESVLNQTFSDFEFIIIDDASTDSSPAVLDSYNDPRLVRLGNKNNQGLSSSLNKGLKAARGDYIARMDADDVALPERLERQVHYLEEHPSVGVLGSTCRLIDAHGASIGMKSRPLDDIAIRWAALLRNPFLHPSVMIRHDVVRHHDVRYDEQYRSAQDYELFTRMLEQTQGANLDNPLMLLRVHGSSVSTMQRAEQLQNHDTVAVRTIRATVPGFPVTPEEVRGLRELFVDGSASMAAQKNTGKLAILYLDLLERFAALHADSAVVSYVQRREALHVARSALRHPLQWGCMKVFFRTLRVNPEIPTRLLRIFLESRYRKLKDRIPAERESRS